MSKLKLSFFGAPEFAATVLERILKESSDTLSVCSIFTQSDKPVGRKQIITPTPVKILANKYGIPVFDDLDANIDQLKNVDLVLLYAYGKLLPPEILKIPKWGFWNIHPSLLPRYRGTSPIAYSLLMGDKTTGVSLIEMDERMDHGQILNQQIYEIQKEDTRDILENRLSDIGYELFKQSIQLLINGSLQKKEQNHEERTFTRLLTKHDGYIPFPLVQKIIRNEKMDKNEIPPIISDYMTKNKGEFGENTGILYWDLFRGLTPWPGLWTILPDSRRLKITCMELENNHPKITAVQLEGKKEVDFSTFSAAYKVF